MAQMIVNVTSGTLNLRSQPTTKGSILAKLPNGTAVDTLAYETVTADGYTWMYVSANGKKGYVASKYLKSATSSNKSTEDKSSKKEEKMGLSENVKKYAKIGVIAALAAGGLYFGYKFMTKGSSKSSKSLSGIGRKKRKNKKYKKLMLR